MTPMPDLRDVAARAMWDDDVRLDDLEEKDFFKIPAHIREHYLRRADAVLAALHLLPEVTGDVIAKTEFAVLDVIGRSDKSVSVRAWAAVAPDGTISIGTVADEMAATDTALAKMLYDPAKHCGYDDALYDAHAAGWRVVPVEIVPMEGDGGE